MNVFKRLYLQLARGGVLPIEELRRRGMTIGENCHIYTNKIDYPHAHLITLGDNVGISDARLLAHDASTKPVLGYSKVGRIDIGDNVFVGVDALILPNVKIGSNVIIGAGTVVSKNIPDNVVVVGNPARVICTYDEYMEKNKKLFEKSPIFTDEFKTEQDKQAMRDALENNIIGFDV
ncbi:MAG: acyltransferase [Pseudobutyrivibrio sp.]|nr:acyltransferase [Pseudobutyrivibrio sp.]